MGLFHELANSGLTAEQIAAAADAVGQFPIRASGGLTSETDGRGGTTITDNPAYHLIPDVRVGMVADGGPNGERDYTDERYWVLSLVTTDGGGNKPTKWAQDGTLEDRFITATHAFEAKDGTHTLAAGDMVLLLHFATVDHVQDVYVCLGLPKPKGLLWGTLDSDWSPGDNTVTLQPCKAWNDPTSKKQDDGVTPVATVPDVYIQFPISAVTPCFQPLKADNKPLPYLTDEASGQSYLVNPQLWPNPQNQYEVILAISAAPPHWVNSYPLIHN